MNAFDASDSEIGRVQCAVCEKLITGGHWFARIRRDERVVALCCPLCTEVFERNPRAYLRRIEMLERKGSLGAP